MENHDLIKKMAEEENQNKNNSRRTLICIAIDLSFIIISMLIMNLFSADNSKEAIKIICNAFFIGGVFIFCSGVLVWCANMGTFDMMGYGIKSTLYIATHVNIKNRETFLEYKEKKEKNRQPFSYMLAIGLITIDVSMLLLIVYRLI